MKPKINSIKGKFVILNDEILPTQNMSSQIFTSSPSIYEVIRIIDGTPLFIEDHILRLRNSASFILKDLDISVKKVASQIKCMAKKNELASGNIKLVCTFSDEHSADKSQQQALFFIAHHYPTADEYTRGISLKSLTMERPTPNAKIAHPGLSREVDLLKKSTLADEVLLVRHDGLITEGSKSNIFFIDHDKLITAKRDYVLPGITREKVMEICKENGIPCEEKEIPLTDLGEMCGAFITGTSPKVLPVRSIDQLNFDVSLPLLVKIKSLYNDRVSGYLNSYGIVNE